MAHSELSSTPTRLRSGQAAARRLREAAARAQAARSSERQFAQKRLADALADIYAQIAVLSRVTAIFDDQGVEPSGQERYIARDLLHPGRRAA